MRQSPITLDPAERAVVAQAISDTCALRDWTLHACNVRSNHVHVVVAAPVRPERVMNALKAWATRRLRDAPHTHAQGRVWSRHGSTIYLYKPEKVSEKIRYVRDLQ